MKTIQIEDHTFELICSIEPEHANGLILQDKPQARFDNEKNLPLNKYGEGAFCRFRIPKEHTIAGVYVVTSDDDPKYVGECENLSSRYNTGYGQISPRNCFKGGQETNCRINKLILNETLAGRSVKLWFKPTAEYKAIERDLRNQRAWPWNRV